ALDSLGRLLDRVVIGDVALADQRVAASALNLALGAFEPVDAAGYKGDFRPVAGEAADDSSADACRGAGNDHHGPLGKLARHALLKPIDAGEFRPRRRRRSRTPMP